MNVYAKCRDYREGETFPFVHTNDYLEHEVKYFTCTETLYPCWQPDELDDAEFNLVILLHGAPVLVRGIHFDFVEVDDE